MRRKFAGFVIAGLFAMGSVVVVAAQPASATNNVVCNAAGNIFVSHLVGNKIQMKVSGLGRCNGGDNKGPYFMSLAGTGTATTLSPCGTGLPIVTGFNIPVKLSLQSFTNSLVITYNVTWRLLVSTFPRITAFTIAKNGMLVGAGTILTGKTVCEGDLNSSAALYDFDFINDLIL